MRTLIVATALVLGFTTPPARAYYPGGCPCVPAYNAIDFSAIDFSTGLPHCMSPFFAPFTLNGCTPGDLYYARYMGPYQPELSGQFGIYFYPFPFVPPYNGGAVCPCTAVAQQPYYPRPMPPVAPAPLPTKPAMHHTPKAGPPVIDAVDPFTVSNKERSSRDKVDVTAPSVVDQKPIEFDLPRVSPINNAPLGSGADDVTPPLPPDVDLLPATGPNVRPMPSSIILPTPRFVPGRSGNV